MTSRTSENEIKPASQPYPWTYWLERSGSGKLYLWSQCTLPSGERKAHATPITLEQVAGLASEQGQV